MVLGTVSATNAASQQLRLDYITTKPLSSFSAFKDALPEQQRDLDTLQHDFADVFALLAYLLTEVLSMSFLCQPPFQRMYRLVISELQEVQRQITELLTVACFAFIASMLRIHA